MTRVEHSLASLERFTLGQPEAKEFLILWNQYVHEIDDIIDGDRPDPEAILATFALAAVLYSTPFYLRNLPALRQIVYNCTNAFADSVQWEDNLIAWRAQWADHYRHFGAEMIIAIAGIVGGYGHMRAISLELRTVCYNEHHTPDGKTI